MKRNRDMVSMDGYNSLKLEDQIYTSDLQKFKREAVILKRSELHQLRIKHKRDNSMYNRNQKMKMERFHKECHWLEEGVDLATKYAWLRLIKYIQVLWQFRVTIDNKIDLRSKKFQMVRISKVLNNFLVPIIRCKRPKQINIAISVKMYDNKSNLIGQECYLKVFLKQQREQNQQQANYSPNF